MTNETIQLLIIGFNLVTNQVGKPYQTTDEKGTTYIHAVTSVREVPVFGYRSSDGKLLQIPEEVARFTNSMPTSIRSRLINGPVDFTKTNSFPASGSNVLVKPTINTNRPSHGPRSNNPPVNK